MGNLIIKSLKIILKLLEWEAARSMKREDKQHTKLAHVTKKIDAEADRHQRTLDEKFKAEQERHNRKLAKLGDEQLVLAEWARQEADAVLAKAGKRIRKEVAVQVQDRELIEKLRGVID